MSVSARIKRLWRYWLSPILPIGQFWPALRGTARLIREWRQYGRMAAAEPLSFLESQPCGLDATAGVPYDSHYVYQAIWAARLILNRQPLIHLDVGSDLRFVSQLAAAAQIAGHRVIGADLRIVNVRAPGLSWASADLLCLPFANGSQESISCLHVVEHVGLGRYGDRLNPEGSRLACRELARILAPGGSLYLSVPVGRPRVQFNAHRIFSPEQVLAMCGGLTLLQFSGVDDNGLFHENCDPGRLSSASYACGMFHFLKRPPA